MFFNCLATIIMRAVVSEEEDKHPPSPLSTSTHVTSLTTFFLVLSIGDTVKYL